MVWCSAAASFTVCLVLPVVGLLVRHVSVGAGHSPSTEMLTRSHAHTRTIYTAPLLIGSTPNLQTIQERHKALLQKAQEELEGNTSNKLSLKATLTDQIKEQENTLAAVKEVKSDRLVLFKQNFQQN